MRESGSHQNFISVAHDVWDKKRNQINDMSIFVTRPETLETRRIPVALTPPLGKYVMSLCNTCVIGLEWCGIDVEELYRRVNSNCTTSAKRGKCLIAGDEETLAMTSEDVADG